MTTPSVTSSEETEQSIRSLDPVPTALLELVSSDGYYDLITYELGTEFTSVHTARVRVRSNQFVNLADIKPTFFNKWPGFPRGAEGIVIIDRMKDGLYSRPEASEHRKDLAAIARRIPYLKDRYTNTDINDHPEIWLLADYILWLTNKVILGGTNSKKSIDLYMIAFNAAPKLKGRYVL
ncbi:hypothetical protein BPOR_0492g00010 [Botrytis porri]|uniref:Uncharacterized protein n=1 Tax=Botrytis porri TaxID=87229 RepID=A0A4Z1KGQ7_9HELO|nr:hypothetical protein BPOR_0492g00010 [Botrytis porri]